MPHVKTGNLKVSVRWHITILLGFFYLHEQFCSKMGRFLHEFNTSESKHVIEP